MSSPEISWTGDAEKAGNGKLSLASENPPFAAILASWEDPAAAREAVRRAYAAIDESVVPLWRVLARLQMGALAARFDDPELALTAFEDTFAAGPEQIYAMWRPVYRDMRTVSRYPSRCLPGG